MDTDSSSLVDLALESVVGIMDSQGRLQSPGSSASSKEKKKKATSEEKIIKYQLQNWPGCPQTSLSSPLLIGWPSPLLKIESLL